MITRPQRLGFGPRRWPAILAGAVAVFVVLAAEPARAQTPVAPSTAPTSTAPADPTAFTSTLDAVTLGDLPTSDNLFAVLATSQPAIISDRFSGGGLNLGTSARLGAFGSSWTQTRYRIGNIDITDPDGSGTPLLFPDLWFWQRVAVTTGLTGPDENSSGPTVALEPRQPTPTWAASVDASMANSGMVAPGPASGVPPIATLRSWGRADALVSGPLVPGRLGLAVAFAWSRSTQLDRGVLPSVTGRVASGLANLVFTPTPRDAVRTVIWAQQVQYPFVDRLAWSQPGAAEADGSADMQSTWTHKTRGGMSWRLFGSYVRRRADPGVQPQQTLIVDRLADGPVPDIATAGVQRDRRWSIGARVSLPARMRLTRHQALAAGLEVDGERMQSTPVFSGLVGELVDGIPARVWQYTSPGIASSRHATTIGAYVSDHVALGRRVSIDAGLRFDAVTGAAAGAANGVRWGSWLPRASVRWLVFRTGHIAIFSGYQRSAWQLPLNLLAYGDPAAPVASVFRWDAPSGTTTIAPSAIGPLVARVGPGTGGNPAFVRIDSNLARPTEDKGLIGIQTRPVPGLQLEFAGIAARQQDLIGLVDVGAPPSAYSVSGLPDPGLYADHPQILPIYNRLPASYGQDQYVLTNPAGNTATFVGTQFTVRVSTRRLWLLFGATAMKVIGQAPSPGFLPTENDVGVIGSLFTDPNAATHSRGRLFDGRSFTMRIASTYRFPWDVHAGIIARYQDGQPFSRLVIVPGLNQGAELIRANPNGGSRFTFTMTLDARIRKGFTVGGHRLALVVDAWNLLNQSNEVQEYVLSGTRFRTPTLVQPPRTFDVGFQLAF